MNDHETTLRELAPTFLEGSPAHAACLAGAEALRLLREYQDAWHAFLAVPDEHDSTREHQALSAAQAALLATEVTRHQAERAEGRLREISALLADAGIPGGTTIYGGVMMLRERAERSEAAPPADTGAPPVLVALAEKWRAEAAEYPIAQNPCADWAATAVRLCANELERALRDRPAPPDDLVALVREWQDARADLTIKVDAEELPGHDQAAENALHKAHRRDEAAMKAVLAWVAPASVAAPELYPGSDRGLAQMFPGVSLPLLRGIQEAAFRAGRADMAAQVASPAPETPAPVDVPACPDGQHSYRRNAPPQNGDVCFVCRKSIWWETPAPDAMPECPNCGGMGTTFHDILIGGTEHDTEERDCDVCKGTGRRQEAQS
jgi:hypothetical protein